MLFLAGAVAIGTAEVGAVADKVAELVSSVTPNGSWSLTVATVTVASGSGSDNGIAGL